MTCYTDNHMNTLSTQPPKGFRDMYPTDMAIRNWLFSSMRDTAQSFGYQEYDGPIVESIELYKAKSSEELVEQQTFQINDRGGRTLALRPEMTPSLARMVAAKQQELTYPLRLFNIGPRFRYEAPQRGRGREFYQWDVDMIGLATPESDAEILAVVISFFKTIGFTSSEIVVKVNNRKLMEFKASLLDIPKSDMPRLFGMIDKRDKMDENTWTSYLKEQGLSGQQITNLQSILNDRDASFESEELTATFSLLKDMDLESYIEFDPSIVRGLDYYTGTVFEVRDRKGAFRALAGGGRYDNLIELFGGTPLSGIGFACGDMVVTELLREYNKLPPAHTLRHSRPDVLVTVFDESSVRKSVSLSVMFREHGIATALYPSSSVKIDKQLKYADKLTIPFVIIAGPNEIAEKHVVIKDLRTGTQYDVCEQDAADKLRSLMNAS